MEYARVPAATSRRSGSLVVTESSGPDAGEFDAVAVVPAGGLPTARPDIDMLSPRTTAHMTDTNRRNIMLSSTQGQIRVPTVKHAFPPKTAR
jgi:hypothetical protein